eukprot:CAMPEP_0116923190 /NCGR_PEP_ID=MMETSP0467-20121206/22719_1 /TAXON_ID=283647 /ORGANISM="Mesodinium pulex, Strain SPMC105" /LENGTH=144 /DNA_ID=CAMNT_0004601683 /DNA_START=100 /DNA_END=536 /DNA_ORIENTATION=+
MTGAPWDPDQTGNRQNREDSPLSGEDQKGERAQPAEGNEVEPAFPSDNEQGQHQVVRQLAEYFDNPRVFDNTGFTTRQGTEGNDAFRNTNKISGGPRDPHMGGTAMTFRMEGQSPQDKTREKHWNASVTDFTHFNRYLYRDNRA